MRSDSSRQSDAGLSWCGSFVGSIKEDEFEDYGGRQDRMPSAMAPSGGEFEKGEWVSTRNACASGNIPSFPLKQEIGRVPRCELSSCVQSINE